MNDVKKIARNIIVFLILIVITFTLIFRKQNISEVKEVIFNIDVKYMLIAILAMICYILFESINIKSVLKSLGNKVSIFSTFRYTLIGFFFSGITPAASGGQPMEIYFMRKDGIPVHHGTLALLFELISFQIVIISSCILGAIINPHLLSNGVIYLFIAGISLNFIALSTMLICFISEKLAKKITDLFLDILKFFKYKKIEEKRESIYSTLNSYTENAKILKKNKMIFVKSIILVIIQMYIYYTIPYWVYRAFGLNSLSIFDIIFTQSLLFCSVSSIPLPGSVGISESAFLRIYGDIFGKELLTSATILNRFINFYLFIIIALICVIYSFIKVKNEKIKSSLERK